MILECILKNIDVITNFTLVSTIGLFILYIIFVLLWMIIVGVFILLLVTKKYKIINKLIWCKLYYFGGTFNVNLITDNGTIYNTNNNLYINILEKMTKKLMIINGIIFVLCITFAFIYFILIKVFY
jgi:hypothetical protein